MIDVSSEQSSVAWNKVANTGIKRAAVRLVRGNDGDDMHAGAYVKGAQSVGIEVFGYCAIYPIKSDPSHPGRDALAQAALFVAAQKRYGLASTSIFLDVEWPEQKDFAHWGVTPDTIREWLVDCVHEVERLSGLLPGIYGSPSYLMMIGCGTVPELAHCPLWVAHYGVQSPTVPPPWSNWSMWQYSETGHVDGVLPAVDLGWAREATA